MTLHLHNICTSHTHIIPCFDFISCIFLESIMGSNNYTWAVMDALDELFTDSNSPEIVHNTPNTPLCMPLERGGPIGIPLPGGKGPTTLPLQTATAQWSNKMATAHFPLPAMHCSLPPKMIFPSPPLWIAFPPSEMSISSPSSPSPHHMPTTTTLVVPKEEEATKQEVPLPTGPYEAITGPPGPSAPSGVVGGPPISYHIPQVTCPTRSFKWVNLKGSSKMYICKQCVKHASNYDSMVSHCLQEHLGSVLFVSNVGWGIQIPKSSVSIAGGSIICSFI